MDPKTKLTGSIGQDLPGLQQVLRDCDDVRIRKFQLPDSGKEAVLIYSDGITNKIAINRLTLLLLEINADGLRDASLGDKLFTVGETSSDSYLSAIAAKVLRGCTALLVESETSCRLIDTYEPKTRAVEEPLSEAVVRGPRVGFTESLSDNIAILRQQGENPGMAVVTVKVGTTIKKDLAVVYIKDIADPELVEEVMRRIRLIDLDHIAESGYVEQLIEDDHFSPFPQLQNTERPDRVVSAIVEGRVAILLDGTPFAVIAPATVTMMLQSPEDYYERWVPGTLIRVLRFGAAIISLFAPALYISLISFHPGLIPTKLAITIMGTRLGVPFSSLTEALIMEGAIEVLREAGLRLPKGVGSAMGIVGGIIIGEAAVQAGIVSPTLVVVVALTAVCSFSMPQYSTGLSFRMLRFVAMFCSALFGLYGIILFFLILTSHMAKLTSFGVPYLTPAVPYRLSDWKDVFVRVPLAMMKRRPKMMRTIRPKRKGS
ncbi:spore germination protein [Paenibacillus thailandensis]|uniref:Spore germination protein n=1 Tax=Paenibacillus thailandensis TaxID=393250 RepID=A0ABW5QSF7_9BACL